MIKQQSLYLTIKKGVLLFIVLGIAVFNLAQIGNLKNYFSLDWAAGGLKIVSNYLSNEKLENYSILNLDEVEVNLIPNRLIIENAQINLPIVSVPLKNGTWKVLDNVVNYAEETSLINTKNGNVGLYGHDRPQTLANIKNVNVGDEVIILSGEYQVSYSVTEKKVVEPGNVETFFPTETPILTISTCDGTFSENRFVVRAKLVSIGKVNCTK